MFGWNQFQDDEQVRIIQTPMEEADIFDHPVGLPDQSPRLWTRNLRRILLPKTDQGWQETNDSIRGIAQIVSGFIVLVLIFFAFAFALFHRRASTRS